MSLAAGLLILTHAVTARAEVVTRKPSESDGDFMARVVGRPPDELAQKVVRSKELAGGKVTLIGFVNLQDDSPDQGGASLVGHLLIESSPNQYEHVSFPSCDAEVGPPELLAVFFARTVKGGGRDLAVLCQWYAHSVCYGSEFYRVKDGGSKTVVDPVKELKKPFFVCDGSERDGRGGRLGGHAVKLDTVAGVKKQLTKMGLKQ
jgi:hypothetical protein